MSLAFHRASVAQWYSIEVLKILLCPTLATKKKKNIFLYFFTELKPYHLSHSNYKNTYITDYLFILKTTLNNLSFVQIQTT